MHCHVFKQLQIQGLGLHKAPTCNLSVGFNVTASHQGLGLPKEATGIFLSGLSVMLRQRAPAWPQDIHSRDQGLLRTQGLGQHNEAKCIMKAGPKVTAST